ncbi:MAG TPA: MarR family transcriptional regulator [Actinocrinis sp.]|nr:MarR family transcriptional regulator [Actinocrinis sp.]
MEPAVDAEPVAAPRAEAAADLRAFALELGGALSGIHRATRRRVRGELGLDPLSGAQVELLRLVAQSPGIGVSAAARELNLAGNSVSTLVNQLVAKNYLRREPSPSDRRAAVLSATDTGHERLARWADQRTRLFAEQLAHLDPGELDALRAAVPALRRLAAGLTEKEVPQ